MHSPACTFTGCASCNVTTGKSRREHVECGPVPEQMMRDCAWSELATLREEIAAFWKQGIREWLQWAHTAADAGAGAAHALLRKAGVNVEAKGIRGYIDELRIQRLGWAPR